MKRHRTIAWKPKERVIPDTQFREFADFKVGDLYTRYFGAVQAVAVVNQIVRPGDVNLKPWHTPAPKGAWSVTDAGRIQGVLSRYRRLLEQMVADGVLSDSQACQLGNCRPACAQMKPRSPFCGRAYFCPW